MSEVAALQAGMPAPATLVGAIAAVMSEVNTVAKLGFNKFHGYRYTKMEDLLKEITPLLGRHGLVIFQSETGRAMFDEDNVIAVEYAFTVAHVSGETWPQPLRQTGVSTCRNSKGGWDDKSLNKCHTAARKYFLLALFQIPTGEEADADQGENDRRQGRPRNDQASPAVTDGQTRCVVSRPPSPQGSISERAIAARAERSAHVEITAEPTDFDVEVRRAAAQLKSKLPQYVVEPPKRKLDRMLDKARNTGTQYEAQIRADLRREGKFRQPLQQYDERNPPPDDDIPGFLERRRR